MKTTRIWKETRGQATNIDRIVVVSDETPKFEYRRLASALFEDSKVKIPSITAKALKAEAVEFAG